MALLLWNFRRGHMLLVHMCEYVSENMKPPTPRQSAAIIKSFFFCFFLFFLCFKLKVVKFFNYNSLSINKVPRYQTTEIIYKQIITTVTLCKLRRNYWDVSLVHIHKQEARIGNYNLEINFKSKRFLIFFSIKVNK